MTAREQIIAAAKDWWIDFQATHEDWRYADREAIIYGAFAAGVEAGRQAEREECACGWEPHKEYFGSMVSDIIRARSTKCVK